MNTRSIAFISLALSCASISRPSNNTVSFTETQTKLHQAIENDSATEVRQVIASSTPKGQGNDSAEWFLLKAILSDNTEEIKQATQKIIAEGKNGNAPIIWAALLEKPNAVKILLECSAKIDANIVKYAIKVGDFESALTIVKSGMDISDIIQDCVQLCTSSTNTDSDTILEFIQELINRGYKVNDAWNLPPNLYQAFESKILKLLLKNGANPNQVIVGNRYGNAPLLIATHLAAHQAIEILLDAGANVNQAAKVRSYREPVTSLFVAIAQNNIEVAKLFLDKGADINQAIKAHADAKALTPLALAVERGYSTMVELLLERGARY